MSRASSRRSHTVSPLVIPGILGALCLLVFWPATLAAAAVGVITWLVTRSPGSTAIAMTLVLVAGLVMLLAR